MKLVPLEPCVSVPAMNYLSPAEDTVAIDPSRRPGDIFTPSSTPYLSDIAQMETFFKFHVCFPGIIGKGFLFVGLTFPTKSKSPLRSS